MQQCATLRQLHSTIDEALISSAVRETQSSSLVKLAEDATTIMTLYIALQ
jgi:hypothetical protein